MLYIIDNIKLVFTPLWHLIYLSTITYHRYYHVDKTKESVSITSNQYIVYAIYILLSIKRKEISLSVIKKYIITNRHIKGHEGNLILNNNIQENDCLLGHTLYNDKKKKNVCYWS